MPMGTTNAGRASSAQRSNRQREESRSDVLPTLIRHLPADRRRLGLREVQLAGRLGLTLQEYRALEAGELTHQLRPERADLRAVRVATMTGPGCSSRSRPAPLLQAPLARLSGSGSNGRAPWPWSPPHLDEGATPRTPECCSPPRLHRQLHRPRIVLAPPPRRRARRLPPSTGLLRGTRGRGCRGEGDDVHGEFDDLVAKDSTGKGGLKHDTIRATLIDKLKGRVDSESRYDGSRWWAVGVVPAWGP